MDELEFKKELCMQWIHKFNEIFKENGMDEKQTRKSLENQTCEQVDKNIKRIVNLINYKLNNEVLEKTINICKIKDKSSCKLHISGV